MSQHIEWATTDADIELLDRDERLTGYPEPVTAPYGLLLSENAGGFLIEGTRDDLLAFLDKARAMVEDAPCTHEDVDVHPRTEAEYCRDCGNVN